MFVVRLRAGLGNQLYEYAFCSFLTNYTEEVYVDGTGFRTFQCHDGLEVDKIFDIDLPYASRKKLLAHDMEYTDDFLRSNKHEDMYFDDYWSDMRILDRLDDGWIDFRREYASDYSMYLDGIDFENACPIHVRKGDIDGTSIDVCGIAY